MNRNEPENTKVVGPSDTLLVVDAQGGSLDAFGRLVVRYQSDIHGYVLRIIRDATAAYDVTQEVFLRAHRSLGTLAEPAKFRAWLYAIAVNTCRNWLKQFRREQSRVVSVDSVADETGEWTLPDPSRLASPRTAEELRELGERLCEAIESLPQPYREVAVLRFQQELTAGEISQTLGLSLAATESRLRRAKEKLRAILTSGE